MTKIVHPPYHWIGVVLVAGIALLTLSDVWGQHAGSNAMFEGRPAMAGAQAGTGAMAGPPQGGIGVQGQDNAGIALRRPSGLNDMPQGTVDPAADSVAVNKSVRNDRDLVPRDRSSLAKDQRSATRKARRVAKNTRTEKRHGVASIGE